MSSWLRAGHFSLWTENLVPLMSAGTAASKNLCGGSPELSCKWLELMQHNAIAQFLLA